MLTVAVPTTTNHYVTISDSALGLDAFLCRLRFAAALPPGAVQVAADECIVGFARRCTHMGCRMLTSAGAGPSRPLPTPDGLLRCACHASCFDLLEAGLVVIGPATDWLPMLQLTPIPDPSTGIISSVRVEGWIAKESVPYGMPYGGTTAKPLIA